MKTEDKLELGRRIKAWREFTGRSRDEVAVAVGVTTVAVIQWETGETSPTHLNLAAAVDAIGITMSQFWGPVPPTKRTSKRKAA